MRITGGIARGIQLRSPTGDNTRPATDQMREAIFSSLGPIPAGTHVVDLFAGTGSYGLEALSRGATHCAFYEKDSRVRTILSTNLANLAKALNQSPASLGSIHGGDALKLKPQSVLTQLIFVDPPYHQIESLLSQLFEGSLTTLASPGCRLIFELPGETTLPTPGWTTLRRLGKPSPHKPNALILIKP